MKAWICLVLVMFLNGCVAIPEGRRLAAGGAEFKKTTIAFLDLPDATRAETLANLGTPAWEAHELRVLVYVWQDWYKWQYSTVGQDGPRSSYADLRYMCLFVAYDSQGRIMAHEARRVEGVDDLEDAARFWVMSRK